MNRYTAAQTVAAVIMSAAGLTVAVSLILAWLDRAVRRAVGLPAVTR